MKRLLLILPALLLFAVTPTATARNAGDITIGPGPDVLLKASPLLAAKPPPQTVVVNETVTPRSCDDAGSSSTFCDRIQVNVETPPGYNESYRIHVTLRWDDSGGNNMGIARWQTDNEDDSTPVDKQFSQGVNPKKLTIDNDPLGMFFTVINLSGTNRGYEFQVSFEEIPFETIAIPTLEPRSGRSTFKPGSTPKPRSTPTIITFTAPTPKPTPREILRPGDDSGDRSIALPSVKGGDRAPPKDSLFDPVVAMVTGVLLASGAVVGGLAIRNRRRQDGDIG